MEQALAAHERIRKSTDLPLFYGRKEKDTIDPHDFLKRFEVASQIARWVPAPANPGDPINTARKCQEFYMLLRDKALVWYQSLNDDPDCDLDSWDFIKREFMTTFAPRYTARSACMSFSELVQRAGECVTDFYLRVSRVYHLLKEIRPAEIMDVRFIRPALNQADEAQRNIVAEEYGRNCKQEGIDDMGRYMIKQIFTAGLAEEIRIKTMEANIHQLNASYKRALEVETILRDKRGAKALINPIQREMEEDESQNEEDDDDMALLVEQVNAIRIARGKKPLRYGKKKNFNKKIAGTMLTCHYCKKTGHFQEKCYKRIRDKAPMKEFNKKVHSLEGEQDEDDENDEGNVASISQSFSASSFYGLCAIKADYVENSSEGESEDEDIFYDASTLSQDEDLESESQICPILQERSQWFEETSSLNPLKAYLN